MNSTITEGAGQRLMVNDSFKSDERRKKVNMTTLNVADEGSVEDGEAQDSFTGTRRQQLAQSMIRPSLKGDLFKQSEIDAANHPDGTIKH